MYLFQAKSPGESKGRWDYLKPVNAIPAEEAFRPLKDGGRSLVDTKYILSNRSRNLSR